MNKICFVRVRSWGKDYAPMVDIQYKSGRLVSIGYEDLPKTVIKFMQVARLKFAHNDIYGRYLIYWPRE